MPKKQKRSKFPFAHPTKHGRLHWKKAIIIILCGAFGLLLAAAILAQFFFNRYVFDSLRHVGVFEMRLLIQDAMEGLEDIKSSPEKGSDGRLYIPEARLVLPKESEQVRKLLYFYNPRQDDPDGAGEALAIPETLDATTSAISKMARGSIYSDDMEEMFNRLPEAQACIRGYHIYFEPQDGSPYELTGSKQLSDGRTLYLYGEPYCQLGDVEALGDFLLQANSY